MQYMYVSKESPTMMTDMLSQEIEPAFERFKGLRNRGMWGAETGTRMLAVD
jgi:hypothetical protein